MAGLAALLSFDPDKKRTTQEKLDALSGALAPRGSDAAVTTVGAARLLIRAALPKIYESAELAMIVDGIAETTSLVTRYAAEGATGLLGGPSPYALVLAEVDGLVLARHQAGPPLYFARSQGSVLVASEPVALLAAGVPAEPDETVIARYLEAGVCDELPQTFFAGIRQVLPGQVVEITRQAVNRQAPEAGQPSWVIHAHPAVPARSPQASGRAALLEAAAAERTGVLFAPGRSDQALPEAVLLAAALAARQDLAAVPVYSANFPFLAGGGEAGGGEAAKPPPPGQLAGPYANALLGPIPEGKVRHQALPFFADEVDVDEVLRDVGEPLPDLGDYLLWAMARATAGEVDVLLSAAGWRGPAAYCARLGDRLAARYGVTLQFPFRELDSADEAVRVELRTLAERALPYASMQAAAAAAAGGGELPLRDVLRRLRAEVAETLYYSGLREIDYAGLAVLADLDMATPAELHRLWRRYVLERWLSTVLAPWRRPGVPASRATPPTAPGELAACGRTWRRLLLGLEPIVEGDRLAEKVAWYVAEFADTADQAQRAALAQPWHVVIAAKPVAVVQGRASAIWEIRPGPLARALTRLTSNGKPGGPGRLRDPWSMQVALEEGGRARMALAMLCVWLRRPKWYRALAGSAVLAISPPRRRACPPAQLCVVRAPQDGAKVAAQVVAGLRRALPDALFAGFRGCSVVGASPEGVRHHGWAGPAEPPPDGLIEQLCGDNPFGQADERTPVLVLTQAPARSGAPSRKPRRYPSRRK